MLTKLFLIVLVAFSDGSFRPSIYPTIACPTKEAMKYSIGEIVKANKDVTDVKMACFEINMNFSHETPKAS